MNVANAKVNEMNIKLKDKGKQIVSPIVGSAADMNQAVSILEKQGVQQRRHSKGAVCARFLPQALLDDQNP